MSKPTTFSLLLGSRSPRRRQLLEAVGFNYRAVLPEGDEAEAEVGRADQVAQSNAVQKARSVLPQLNSKTEIVLGSDTLVVLDEIAIGKPKDRDDARSILRKLSGRTHTVVSGICLIHPVMGERSAIAKSRVTFRALSESDIEAYTLLQEPYDKAGAYAVQGASALFIASIEGSFSNVMGLPVELLIEELAALIGCSTFDLFARN